MHPWDIIMATTPMEQVSIGEGIQHDTSLTIEPPQPLEAPEEHDTEQKKAEYYEKAVKIEQSYQLCTLPYILVVEPRSGEKTYVAIWRLTYKAWALMVVKYRFGNSAPRDIKDVPLVASDAAASQGTNVDWLNKLRTIIRKKLEEDNEYSQGVDDWCKSRREWQRMLELLKEWTVVWDEWRKDLDVQYRYIRNYNPEQRHADEAPYQYVNPQHLGPM